LRALDKKCINISSEVRSLTEELKIGPREVIKKSKKGEELFLKKDDKGEHVRGFAEKINNVATKSSFDMKIKSKKEEKEKNGSYSRKCDQTHWYSCM